MDFFYCSWCFPSKFVSRLLLTKTIGHSLSSFVECCFAKKRGFCQINIDVITKVSIDFCLILHKADIKAFLNNATSDNIRLQTSVLKLRKFHYSVVFEMVNFEAHDWG